MGFVKELVPLEGPEREWLDSFKFTYHGNDVQYEITNKTGKILARRHWAIDREEEIFLINLGGGGLYGTEGLPNEKFLVKKNKVISKIFTRSQITGENVNDTKVQWDIEEIIILKDYESKSLEIINRILESLIVMGDEISSDTTPPLEIKFDHIAEPVLSTVIDYE